MDEVSPKQIKTAFTHQSNKGTPLQPSKEAYKPALVQAQQDLKIKEIIKKNLKKV